ncbi:Fanconi anemia group I protein-like [Anneissia japonica]|uniref:Fanconi anemia group I protein-like n=1 Tax=Anneissia japonica TaxID=1529436 RepID=UPI0014255A1C|nr:Fanconi anemia group I protein-like [Anneissia japonica]XP_033114600.1 Fanconi anemia group I protein-like [Anneissia japonica]
MDQKIVNLYECGRFENLTKQVTSLIDTQKISEMLTRRVIGTAGDPISLLRALLRGCDKDDNGMKARHLIFTASVKLLQDSAVNIRVATDVIGFLLVETDKLSSSSLAELSDVYIEAVKSKEPASGRAFELLPKILSTLAARDNVIHGNSNMSGSKFKDRVLNNLCSSRWEPHCILPLTSIFREIPMMSEQLAFVIKKVIRGLPTMNLQEVPPLIYQLLVLTTRGHKDLVLQGILNFFNNIEKQDKMEESEDIFSVSTVTNESIQHTEGTVIVHVTFAVRQNQPLGKELVRILKDRQQGDPSAVLQPFTTALILAISRIHTFTEQMITILKTSIFRCYKDIEKHNESKFIEEIASKIPDIDADILSIVKNSSMGWDHVTQGLIELGFSLMESYGPKSAFGGRVAVQQPTAILTPTQKACQLGLSILQEIFKMQEAARQDVLEQVLNHLITSSVHPVYHYLKLLSNIIHASPQSALDFQMKIRETFDYLTQLPLETAEGLLVAIQPLVKVSITLKDALMLMLRKALFSRQVEGRKLAATGYLLILKNFKVYGSLPSSQCSQIACSSSQVFVDVHQKGSPDYEAIVCSEILGSLRRSFNQQADVKLILYEGLYEALSNNSKLKGEILEMLSNQLEKYYVDDSEVLPPIKLEPCIAEQGDKVYITEPVTHLLMALGQSLLFCKRRGQEDEEENVNVEKLVDKLDGVLKSLATRMISSEMEDFELDKSADYSMDHGVGVRNNIFAILVLGIYEVLMEYVIGNGDYSSTRCEQLLQLYKNYSTLSGVLKEKTEAKKGKDTARSLLSIKFVTEAMRALFSLNSPSHDEGLTSLRQNTDFVQHMLLVTQQKIHQVDTKGQCDCPEGTNKDKVFIYCSTLARVFLQQVITPTIENQKKDKSKSVSQQCLESLTTIIHIVCTRYPSKIREFLDLVDVECDKVDDNVQEQIHAYIKKFQRLLISFLTIEDDDANLKDAVNVCTIISFLARLLDAERPQFTELYSWLLRVCAENNPDDVVLTKALISLLLSLTTRIKSGVKLTRDISQDIHSQLGDIDEDVEVDNKTNFAIINPRTAAPSVFLLVISHIENALEEADWILGQMMSQLSSVDVSDPDMQALFTNYEDKENMICVRLGFLINSYHELVQSVIPVGQSIEALLKSLIHTYTTLKQLCKYYLSVYEKENGHFCDKFPKLIKLSGTHLTQQVYALITYIQAAQSEQLQPGDTKATEKAKRKKNNKEVKVDAKTKNAQKVLRGSRSIPNLIYSIEQYERILIKLGKRAKVNLMEHVKLSTSRDFRINFAVVEASLDASSDEQLSEDNESEQEEKEEPKKKKIKRTKDGKK